MISPTQRPLPDDTQHPQEIDIHVPGGIRTCNPKTRAAADPRLAATGIRGAPFTNNYTQTIADYLFDSGVGVEDLGDAESGPGGL